MPKGRKKVDPAKAKEMEEKAKEVMRSIWTQLAKEKELKKLL